MSEMIKSVNVSMELGERKQEWSFNEKHRCWCLTDIIYTPKPMVPKYQQLSIYVPELYMNKDGDILMDGTMNGYSAETAPIIFANNSSGYMQMPHTWLDGPRCNAIPYLERGFVYVTCGNRGHDSIDENGKLCGKAPMNLIDLKTALRFIRHNRRYIPGNTERIISTGWSAGGAMSTLLAVTGNNEHYVNLLADNGAFMDESDAVYASQIYCPIIDLEHADLAYEWMFSIDKKNEKSHAAPAGVMNSFQEELSKLLSKRYITYFNGLSLKHPDTGELLVIGEDGRSGSGYDYLMNIINESARKYMEKQSSVTARIEEVTDLDAYVLNQRRRMKPCTSFDTLACNSAENKVFGTSEEPTMHFSTAIADAIAELEEQFPEEYRTYYENYHRANFDKELSLRKYLINPFHFIGTKEKSDSAEFYRIRVGTDDADTSFTIAMTLALKLMGADKTVDYEMVWEQPHSEADYPNESVDWIENITKGID